MPVLVVKALHAWESVWCYSLCWFLYVVCLSFIFFSRLTPSGFADEVASQEDTEEWRLEKQLESEVSSKNHFQQESMFFFSYKVSLVLSIISNPSELIELSSTMSFSFFFLLAAVSEHALFPLPLPPSLSLLHAPPVSLPPLSLSLSLSSSPPPPLSLSSPSLSHSLPLVLRCPPSNCVAMSSRNLFWFQ